LVVDVLTFVLYLATWKIGMKFEKSRKRKFDGDGDRGGFKRQKWNKTPGQSGANATPLGDRTNGAVANSDERLPASIPRPHGHDDRLENDKSGRPEKKDEKKRESQNEHTNSQENERATEKFGTPKEEKAMKKKGKHPNKDNVVLDEPGMHDGVLDKGEGSYCLGRINDSKTLQPVHLVLDKQAMDRKPKQVKKRKKTLDSADEIESKPERRKAAKNARSEVEKKTHDVGQPTTTEHNNEQAEGSEELAGSAANQKKERFICFVGKFSYTLAWFSVLIS